MSLDSRPARQLTSREAAKIIGAVCGGLLDMVDVDDLCDAIEHFHEHRASYRAYWEAMKKSGVELRKDIVKP